MSFLSVFTQSVDVFDEMELYDSLSEKKKKITLKGELVSDFRKECSWHGWRKFLDKDILIDFALDMINELDGRSMQYEDRNNLSEQEIQKLRKSMKEYGKKKVSKITAKSGIWQIITQTISEEYDVEEKYEENYVILTKK